MQNLRQSIKRIKMKTYLALILMGSFFLFSTVVYSAKENNDQAGGQATGSKISVISSPDLENLITEWISAYRESKSDQIISVSFEADEIAEGSIYFFSSDNPVSGSEGQTDKIIVGHEIIVPVMNAKNPLREKLSKEGMTSGDFSQLISANAEQELLNEDLRNVPLRVYVTDCELLSSKLAAFCGISKSSLGAEKVSSAEELLSAIRKDEYAVGFCRLSDVLNQGENEFAEGIYIVPIDKNQNGQIDRFENIYASPADLTRGAWIGKYPRKLCSEVFAASTSLPMDEASNEFLEWVIDDGQETLATMGFSSLSTREKTAGMLALRPAMTSDFTPPASGIPTIWITVVAALAFLLLAYVVVRAGKKRKSGIQSEDIVITSALNVNSIMAPAGLFYDKTHTWAFMEQDGHVKVGIDDFLPHVTGMLSQIKMKAPGEKIRKGEKILTIIREGKHLDIYSPVTGYIKAQNDSLINNPSQLNTDPYSSGWVYRVEPSNWLREMKFMFMADTFKDWLEDEFVRLKDFLAFSANSNAVVYNHVVLQDGGELTNNVLADLEPTIWEDFQTQFIDASK